MSSKNIAYTEEYREQRREWDYLFEDKYLNKRMNKKFKDFICADGKYTIKFQRYDDPTYNNGKSNYAKYGSILTVFNDKDEYLFEQKSCHYRSFFRYIEHANGNEYLLFAIDLYGYSILNLNTLEVYHYMPEEVLIGGETFIWSKAFYSGTNKIAVEGCYWACDNEFEIYDFSEPERLPYQLLVKHEDLEPEYNNWLNPIGWVTPDEFAYDEIIYHKDGKFEKIRKSVKC